MKIRDIVQDVLHGGWTQYQLADLINELEAIQDLSRDHENEEKSPIIIQSGGGVLGPGEEIVVDREYVYDRDTLELIEEREIDPGVSS